jgi:Tfp pilus assembly protein PilF
MVKESALGSAELKRTVLVAALLSVLTLALFSPAIGYGFVNYDDAAYVYENQHVLQGLNGSGIKYALTTCDIGTWAPLTWLSYECDTTVQGPRASSYHLTNLLLHAAAGALLFVVLRLMRQSLWASVTVAVLFLVHPLRIESVVWIAERKDVLCALAWMLGLIAYWSYAQKPNTRRWFVVFLCFIAGLMSKMMMVTFPFILLLLDFWPLNRLDLNGATPWKDVRRLIFEKIPFFGGIILTLFISGSALHSRGAFSARPTEGLNDLLRVPENYVFYLGKFFWPARLSVLYPLADVRLKTASLCAGLLVVVTLAILWQARQKPWLIVGWLWFLGALVPVVGFVSFGDFVVADRYTYLPSVGIAWALVAWADHALRRYVSGRWIATAIVALACAGATAANLPRWRDSLSLYDAALRIGPHYVTYNNRGAALLKAGETQAALADFESAIRLNPNYSWAYNNRGSVLSDLGHYEEAISDFEKAIELNPYCADAYDNRGNALARKGEPEKALTAYARSLELDPNSSLCYNNRASAYFQLKRFPEAIADIESCRRLGGQPHPGLVQALAEAMKQKP